MSEMLSRRFSLAELTGSDTAARRSINNTPNAQQVANLKRLCAWADLVADDVGGLLVSSGYRCPALNVIVGGSRTSSHCAGGQAAAMDARPAKAGVTLTDIVNAAQKHGPWDQIIYEFGRWVHLSDRNEAGEQRCQVLMAFSEGGRTVYLPWNPKDPRVTS